MPRSSDCSDLLLWTVGRDTAAVDADDGGGLERVPLLTGSRSASLC